MAANRSWVDEYRARDPLRVRNSPALESYTYSYEVEYSEEDDNEYGRYAGGGGGQDGRAARGERVEDDGSDISFYSDSLYYTTGVRGISLEPFDETLDKAARQARAAFEGRSDGDSDGDGDERRGTGGGRDRRLSLEADGSGRMEAVYVVRHGESTFNAWRTDWKTYAMCGCFSDPHLIDARLSANGEKQVAELRKAVFASAPSAAGWGTVRALATVDVVVVSPLTRALATAAALFAETSIRVLVSPLVTEAMDTECDIGRPLDVLADEFPHFDWSVAAEHAAALGARPDAWWPAPEHKESAAAVADRASLAHAWMQGLGAPRIALVSHSNFLKAFTKTTSKLPNAAAGVLTVAGFARLQQ
ncbi:phosphoglycerate mutase [Thecamonas trahens ATCC 50062]|uniref:Phosphoglycerate mutase n=1 Tax=Thecamonas trahens ATCC 50062 TaxID=461836 RepID=A0A0L0DQS2_THETB|nr:phosphoglycerate mutase [Thecamonas trahens ATCC 50062]KNC54625.1 phosphoglycerate mutase [Thecamonas trahens ATCC 50062]|eukprot:XP_013761532.1 phosphoglycerate mutase [Thecamonas trahens ATCC 50062]